MGGWSKWGGVRYNAQHFLYEGAHMRNILPLAMVNNMAVEEGEN